MYEFPYNDNYFVNNIHLNNLISIKDASERILGSRLIVFIDGNDIQINNCVLFSICFIKLFYFE